MVVEMNFKKWLILHALFWFRLHFCLMSNKLTLLQLFFFVGYPSSLARSLSTSFHFNFHICNMSMHRSLWLNSLCIRKVVCYFFSLSFFLFFSMNDGFFPVPVFILICVVQSCIISAIKNFNLYLFLYLIYKITIFISVILLLLALVHSGNLLCAHEWLWVCSLRLFFVCPGLTCTNEKKKQQTHQKRSE